MCSKYSWQETNFRNSEPHQAESHKVVLPYSDPLWCFFLGGLEQTIRAQHLSPPGKTCRWWPSSPVFRLQFRHWASWFSQLGQPRSTPWIQSLQHTHQFLGSVPGRLRRKPCRPRSDPILQGWHIGPLNYANPHKPAKHILQCMSREVYVYRVSTKVSTNFNFSHTYIYIFTFKLYLHDFTLYI